ncbi:MAG: FAD binding domain-containing protein [Fastidiosipilaceae bacterium]|jgi:putative selenate reductase FAD-binding subunit|nr:hypothetical protein [Clostridiaceae bacterium]
MYTIRTYSMPQTVEEAAELCRKKAHTPLAGTLWTRLGNRRIGTAVDLSALPLRGIEETETGFTIGAMTTLRDVELDESLNEAYDGTFYEAVKDIVGVQLRNAATMGGAFGVALVFQM